MESPDVQPLAYLDFRQRLDSLASKVLGRIERYSRLQFNNGISTEAKESSEPYVRILFEVSKDCVKIPKTLRFKSGE